MFRVGFCRFVRRVFFVFRTRRAEQKKARACVFFCSVRGGLYHRVLIRFYNRILFLQSKDSTLHGLRGRLSNKNKHGVEQKTSFPHLAIPVTHNIGESQPTH